MSVALPVAGLLLAAVFATAGVAKLADLEGSRTAVAAFGLPHRLALPLGTLLPAAELGTAALLGAGAIGGTLDGAVWSGDGTEWGESLLAGARAALALLTLFSAGIASSLVRGRAPDCHCFGQLHSAPASGRTLARNGALLSVAAFVASDGDLLLTAIAATAALAALAMVRVLSRGHASERTGHATSEGLPLGSRAPEFELLALEGPPVTLAALRDAGLPVLLVFTDPHCGPCLALAPEIAEWQRRYVSEVTIAVIETRDGRSLTGSDEHGRRNVLFQRGSEVAELYRAAGTPTAVLIARDGAIASAVAAGGKQIEALMARTADRFQPRSPSAPAVRRGLGHPLRRRELLVRGAGAWAAASAVLAWPLRAAAGVGSKRQLRAAESCEDRFDCPDQRRMRCVDGRCRCGEGLTRCDPEEATDARCFSLQTNEDHCGSCNHPCTDSNFDQCCDGKCDVFGHNRCNCAGDICDEGEVCRDVQTGDTFVAQCVPCPHDVDGTQLQQCGNSCGDPRTQRCCGNKLYDKATLGPGDWTCCGPEGNRRLVNVKEHEANCGGCGRRCAGDEFCYGGRCRKNCPQGLKRCGNTCGDPRRQVCCEGRLHPKSSGIRNCRGRCVNTKSDPKNCGDCGSRCTGPFDTGECCAGKCCDYNADTCCPGGCKNTSLDDDNCGACGNVCGPNSYCRFGVCTCPAEPCP